VKTDIQLYARSKNGYKGWGVMSCRDIDSASSGLLLYSASIVVDKSSTHSGMKQQHINHLLAA